MKIFISSTCYDLPDLRAEVESFFKSKGYLTLLSDRAAFPLAIGKHRHQVCIDEVANCDLFILIIDKRFGAPYYTDNNISVTWAEFREATKLEKEIVAFIRKNIFDERQCYHKNNSKEYSYKPFYADDNRTFLFIDEVQSKEQGIWIQPFENSVEIKEKLNSIYSTEHSIFNISPSQTVITANQLTPEQFSGATASYLTNFIKLDANIPINEEAIMKAINSIPTTIQPFGEVLGFEPMSGQNDYLMYLPIRNTGDEGEMLLGISPTALGKSVRNELEDYYKQHFQEKK